MSSWRHEFPITSRLVHFNHAGISPMPLRVARAVARFAKQATLVDDATQEAWEQRMEAARGAIARLIGGRADEIAFVKNTAEGLSLVAAGLEWRPGDNVIAVDGEYPSNVYPWFALRRHGVETRLVTPVRSRVHADDVAALADSRTRLLAVSFVDWQLGGRTDLAALAELCRRRGILFCVDGIQGVGALPLDVERAGIDCLAAGGHKWLLGVEGCGFLFVSRRVLDRVQSVLHGWKSVSDPESYLPYHFEPRADAAKFEPGSPQTLGIHVLGAAVDFLLDVGTAVVAERVLALTGRLADRLRARGAEILSPWGDGERSGIVTFRPGRDPETVCRGLAERGVVTRVRAGGVRVSPHFYNDEQDMERFFAAFDEVVAG